MGEGQSLCGAVIPNIQVVCKPSLIVSFRTQDKVAVTHKPIQATVVDHLSRSIDLISGFEKNSLFTLSKCMFGLSGWCPHIFFGSMLLSLGLVLIFKRITTAVSQPVVLVRSK